MFSDTYNNIMSFSVAVYFDADTFPIRLHCIAVLRLQVTAFKLNIGPIFFYRFCPWKKVLPKIMGVEGFYLGMFTLKFTRKQLI